MDQVRIRKLEARYRLPLSARAEERRLEQLKVTALDRAFTQAMDQTGLPEESEVCIRSLIASVALDLNKTDESVLTRWSQAMADRIVDSIQTGEISSSSRVVVYHSRRQALTDLAISVGRGDLRRAWAWRQLGLWRSGHSGNEDHAISELVQSLCNEPVMIAPVLKALAESGWLRRIASRITETQWQSLALAPLSSDVADKLLSPVVEAPLARDVYEASRVVHRSSLLSAIASSSWLTSASEVVRRSIAILGVLEVEPMLLRTSNAPTVISIIAAGESRLPDLTEAADPPASSSSGVSAADGPIPESSAASALKQDRMMRGRALDDKPSEVTDQKQKPAQDDFETNAVRDFREGPDANQTENSASTTDAESEQAPKPPDFRRRALTRRGGLLFLLRVVDELNLPEQILAHAALGDRSFIWVLHQLALALSTIDMAHDDPAALAFAGLSPQAPPPSQLDAPATDDETEALIKMRELIVERLTSLLDLEEHSPERLLEFVCRRRAEIVADPGWIEVRLSLDEVSTEVRRAGLDLNPGYLPWLGVVVNFVYE